MNQIKFLNREAVIRVPKTTVLKRCLLVCAIFLTIANIILLLTEGWKETSLFSSVLLPAWIWFSALKKPAPRREEIQVEEELVQTDYGVCIVIDKIDRYNRFGLHSERIMCERDKVSNLIYHQKWNIIEIIGKPVFHFYVGEEEIIYDVMKQSEGEHGLRICCTEENREQILQILQTGLQRIAIQQ